MPAATGLQVPALPATSQASQAPVHAVSQQTPSTQLPLLHSRPVTHAVPCGRVAVHVDARIVDPDDRVLLCQLTYKRDWDLPGGVVDSHPLTAPVSIPVPADIARIEAETGLTVWRFPKLQEFFIGFRVQA